MAGEGLKENLTIEFAGRSISGEEAKRLKMAIERIESGRFINFPMNSTNILIAIANGESPNPEFAQNFVAPLRMELDAVSIIFEELKIVKFP